MVNQYLKLVYTWSSIRAACFTVISDEPALVRADGVAH